MLNQDEIDKQRQLLNAHRHTLSILLRQQAKLGEAYAPPGVISGIDEARAEIRRIKLALRAIGQVVDDHPDDEGQTSSRELSHDQRNRRQMLEKVYIIWIKGVLEKSLYNEVLLALTMEEQPDAVARPWDMVLREHERNRVLSPDTKILDVFDSCGGELLILGAPGSGKTTLLLDLARDFIGRAEQNHSLPIPVIFNLSSWTQRRKPIVEWLADELNTKYDVPERISKMWLDADQVLPLLDGLDEVRAEHRGACIDAINKFRRDHGLLQIVVCSRTADYEALRARLRLQRAVLVQPLRPQQVDAYLASAANQLAALRTAFVSDLVLQELAKSLLMLNIIILAYMGVGHEAIPESGGVEERRRHLLAAYVERMLMRRVPEGSYPQNQTIRWLTWLARTMAQHSQTIFLIEQLQSDWLPSPIARRCYTIVDRLGLGLSLGGVSGLLLGFFFRLREGLLLGMFSMLLGVLFGGEHQTPSISRKETVRTVSIRILKWLGKGLLLGLISGLLLILLDKYLLGRNVVLLRAMRDGLIYGLAGVLLGSLVGGPSLQARRIIVVETLRWSWAKAEQAMLAGLGLGLLLALFFGLDLGIFNGLVIGLGLELLLGLLGGLTGGKVETSVRPNQGIRRSAYSAVQSGLISGLVSVLGIRFLLQMGNVHIAGIVLLLLGGMAGALAYGGYACASHFTLRLILYFNGSIPWNYARFLDSCADRIFLRKVGGGYIFIHRYLMEYFASLDIDHAAESAKSTPS